jgi:hypothetical protein
MNRVVTYLRQQFKDVLFLRVCVAIYGIPITALGLGGLWHFRPDQPVEWLLVAALVCLAAFGLFMTYAAFFGSPTVLERVADGVSDGGEIVGLVLLLAVIVIALPITGLIRSLSGGIK